MKEIVLTSDVDHLSPKMRARLVVMIHDGMKPEVAEEKLLAVMRSKESMDAMLAGMPAWEPRGVGGLKREEILAGEATPQTRKKLKRDIPMWLAKRGVLDADHLIAVEDMRDVAEIFELDGGSTWARDRVDGGRWVSPFEKASSTLYRVYRHRYRPWLASLSDEPIIQMRGERKIVYLCAAAFVRLIVQENYSVAQAEEHCRIVRDKGLGACVLRIALDRYMAIATGGVVDQTAETNSFKKAA